MPLTSSEEPLVCIDHRIYRDEPKVILDIFDLDEIPKKIKFSVLFMRGFDETLREIRRPPPKWLNHWLRLDYHKGLMPVLFDLEGRPYVMAPANKKEVTVKVMIRKKDAEDILERLETATDFCDNCSSPLLKDENEWLMYASGGGAIADIFECPSCEHENIRWQKEFLESHPELA